MGGTTSAPAVVFEITDQIASISFRVAAANIFLYQKTTDPAVIVAATLLQQLNKAHFAALAQFFDVPYESQISGGVIKIVNNWVARAEFSLTAADEQSITEAVRVACRAIFEQPVAESEDSDDPEIVE
jgi:hypothetical protein